MEKDPATVYLYIRSVVKDASHICHNIFIHRFLSETRPAAHHDDYVSHGLEMTGGPGHDTTTTLADLVLDMATVIVERSGVLPAILPQVSSDWSVM